MAVKSSSFKQKTLEEVKKSQEKGYVKLKNKILNIKTPQEKEKEIIQNLRYEFQKGEMLKREKAREKLRNIERKRKEKEKKENSVVVLQRKLWEECKRIIRNKYMTKSDFAVCYTCGKLLAAKRDMHTAHMIPKSVCPPHMKYNLDNLRIQCMVCNVHRGGMGSMFIENMRRIEGDEYVDNILNRIFKSEFYEKVDSAWYIKTISEYANK